MEARVLAIGREELKGVVTATTNGKEILKFLRKAKKKETLSEFLALDGGKLRKAGDEEAKVLKKLAEEMRAAGGDLAKVSLDALRDELSEIAESARIRHPECVRRLHLANGLQRDKGTMAIDSEALWDVVVSQRMGRAVGDDDRGSATLLKSLWAGLTADGGRVLPVINLDKVASVGDEEQKRGEEGDEGGDEGGARAGSKVSKAEVVRRARIVFYTLAAAASATLTNKRSKAPVSSEGVGDVTARDSTGATVTVTLDVSLAECMDALHGLTDRLLKDADGAAAAATFKRFWAKLRKAVSNAGSTRTSVGEGLLRAGQAMAQSDEVVGMAREAKKEAPSRAAPAKKAPSVKGALKRGAGEAAPAAATKAKKAKVVAAEEKKGQQRSGSRKPNSSGNVCGVFRTTGKCRFGKRCEHKHLRPDDDSDEDDVRERGE